MLPVRTESDHNSFLCLGTSHSHCCGSHCYNCGCYCFSHCCCSLDGKSKSTPENREIEHSPATVEEHWRTGVNKEGDLSQAQVAGVDGQDVAGGGCDEGGVGAQEHGHANLTCGPQHIYFPLKIQIIKSGRAHS